MSKHSMPSKDAKKLGPPRIISLFLQLCLITTSLDLVADDSEQPEERWFEVEVILYKAISDAGLTNESWDNDIPFSLPEEIEDFLNPLATPESVEGIEQQQVESQLNQSTPEQAKGGLTTTINDFETNPSDNPNAEDLTFQHLNSNQSNSSGEQTLEQPFVLLDQDLLQLQKEAKNISVHPSFRMLAHFGWRQPVYGKSTATPVRFAGGHDYSETFEFNGSKKLELETQQTLEDQLESEQLINGELSSKVITDDSAQTIQNQTNEVTSPSQQQHNTQTSSLEDENSNTAETSKTNNEPILLPWVPEIDGSAKVYIYRNYLHLDADLVYRQPGQLEVDIYSLETPLNFETDPLVSPISPMTDELQSFEDASLVGNKLQTFSEAETNDENENQFAWHFDSDFLNQDSEKVYTEKLFNYPLQQTRRMRSTELHYFDHPKIGMLVVIRPYEIEAKIEETINE